MKVIETSSSFTRPEDTTAYQDTDLVANSTTAGSVAPLSFDLGVQPHTQCFIRRVRIVSSDTSVTNAAYRVHFYKTSPTPANGDNAAFSTNNAANYLGACDVTLDQVFTDGSFGTGIPNKGTEINFISTTEIIYGLIEAKGAKTPDSAEVITVSVEAHAY